MSMSDSDEPVKKKIRICEKNELKRACSTDEAAEEIKRLRVSTEAEPVTTEMERSEGEDREKALAAQRRRNFLMACEAVSYGHFSDHRRRFLLIHQPSCAVGECVHNSNKDAYMEIPSYAKETFRIDYKSQMWCEALHVCEIALSPGAYLPAELMQYIVEIILNVHPDVYSGFSIVYLLDRCQQILSLMYRTNPPCAATVRKCYRLFLTSSLAVKEGTLSNRSEFGCDKGIVKYCLNRLESELTSEAKDEPLVDKNDYITEEMTQSIKGLHWQKEKLEIFETLDRPERIRRLMVALKSLVELLTSDLSIWLSRHTHKQGTHIMRSHRPLLTLVLWSDNILFTGAVNNNCRQIISLFVNFVRLGFPEDDIKIMTQLLNSMVQTFYICEANSSGDYPHTGKYCKNFASEMFKAIKDLSTHSMVEVISRIQPTFMRHSIAILCIKNVLSSQEDDILMILIDFLKNEKWKEFPIRGDNETDTVGQKIKTARKCNRIYTNFSKIIKVYNKPTPMEGVITTEDAYPKSTEDCNELNTTTSREKIIQMLLVALDAYLDAYSIEKLQENLAQLSNSICEGNDNDTLNEKLSVSYTLSEGFYKKYRTICQHLNEIKNHFRKLKLNPVIAYFKGFESQHLLGL